MFQIYGDMFLNYLGASSGKSNFAKLFPVFRFRSLFTGDR